MKQLFDVIPEGFQLGIVHRVSFDRRVLDPYADVWLGELPCRGWFSGLNGVGGGSPQRGADGLRRCPGFLEGARCVFADNLVAWFLAPQN